MLRMPSLDGGAGHTQLDELPSLLASILQRLIQARLSRFLIVDGFSYAVNQVTLYALFERSFTGVRGDFFGLLDARLLLSSLIALEVSILVRFLLNDHWTFRERHSRPFSVRLYQSNLSSLGGPLIALACVNILTPLFGVSYLLTNSLGVLIGLSWNWFWSNTVVWRQLPEGVTR